MYKYVDYSKVDMIQASESYLDTPICDMGGGVSLESFCDMTFDEIAMEGIFGSNVKDWIKKKFLSLGEAIGKFISWIKTKFLKLVSFFKKQKPADQSTTSTDVDPLKISEVRNSSLSRSNKNGSPSTEPKFQKLTNPSNTNTSQATKEEPKSSSNTKPKKPVIEMRIPANVFRAMQDLGGTLVIYQQSVNTVKFSVKSMTTDLPDDDEQLDNDRITLRHLDKAAKAKSLIAAIDTCEKAMENESDNRVTSSISTFLKWENVANELVDDLTKIKKTIDETIPYLGYSDKEKKLTTNLREYMKHAESYYNTISKVLPLVSRIFIKYRVVRYE